MRSFILFLLLGLTFLKCFAQTGNLDLSFGGGDGYVTTDIADVEGGTNIHVQQDGKILVAGFAIDSTLPTVVILRYTPDGDIDNSFGSNGSVNTGVIAGGHMIHNWSAFQPDGKLVFLKVYDPDNPQAQIELYRYTADGLPDNSFGNSGQVNTAITPYTQLLPWGINLQSDGKILVTGYVTGLSSTNPGGTLLVRYNSNGTLDSSFHADGIAIEPLGFTVGTDALEQSDGKLAVCGVSGGDICGLTRFNSSGSFDNSYGDNGAVLDTTLYEQDALFKFALGDGDKILIAGEDANSGMLRISRNLPNGAPDLSFSGTGTITADFGPYNDFAFDILALPDSKILLLEKHGYIIRLNSDGSFDNTFAPGGLDSTLKHIGLIGAVATRQADGKILITGISQITGEADIFVARLFPSGSTDVKESSSFNEVSIYPNPANDFLTIDGINNSEIGIYSVNGMLISKLPAQTNKIDVRELSAGVYFLEIEGVAARWRFVKL